MKKEEINFVSEETSFFIAKLNGETIWGTEAKTKKQSLTKAYKRLNIKCKSAIPIGSDFCIIKITVSQTLAEQVK